MSSIIEIKNLTKEYRLGTLTGLKSTALKQLRRLRGKPTTERESFKALDNVSFSVERGEVVGIIGHNGAGKSTLLKVLAGIVTPSQGSIAVRGKVAPLIEVGAGLVPDMTGRENIYLNATILGMKRAEIARKLDEIVAFSELEQFIDTPVKRYSSGMQVKLGFSIATSVEAEILIVDEVLAVGDLAFQRKCFDRMEDIIRRQGRTILLVSHNIRQVSRICDRVILLDHGKRFKDGAPLEVCNLFFERSNTKILNDASQRTGLAHNLRSTGEIDLESLKLITRNGVEIEETIMGEPITIRAEITSHADIKSPEVVFGFHTTDFFYIASMSTILLSKPPSIPEGRNVIECHLETLPLVPGVYCIRVGVLDSNRREIFYGETLKIFSVKANEGMASKLPALGVFYISSSWNFRPDGAETKNLSSIGGDT